MKKIEAKIIADSISPQGYRITSVLLTYPRFIHSELMTHRMFSRNSASSRAIPFAKMVKMVEEDPFVPIAWQKDHKGMQGKEYFNTNDEIVVTPIVLGKALEPVKMSALTVLTTEWHEAKYYAVEMAKKFNYYEVTKQLCNRLLEPFMWHTVLVTATEWENFFELRCPKYEYLGEEFRSQKDAINSYTFKVGFEKERLYLTSLTELDWIKLSKSGAEIHIQALAESMWDAMNESVPKKLEAGEWHIPFGDKMNTPFFKTEKNGDTTINWVPIPKVDLGAEGWIEDQKIKIATARCARLSYMTFDGDIDYEKDINLHDHLLESNHMSPFEHCARAMSDEEYFSHFKGNKEWIFTDESKFSKAHGWCDNFKGWISYRHLVEEERRKS